MISRRLIRIKVMQSVYAMIKSHNEDFIKQERFLKHSLLKVLDLYVLNLQLLVEVQKLASKKVSYYNNKNLITKESLKVNTKFVENRLIKKIADSISIKNRMISNKLNNWEESNKYVRVIFDELQKSELYINYMSSDSDSFSSDKEFAISFFKEIIAPNEHLTAYFEDTLISWFDDIPYVNTWILKALNKQTIDSIFTIGSLYKDEDDEEFVSVLFRKSILKREEFKNYMQERTPNWASERVADVDSILITTAMVEFIYFPSIPTRVTINEYIEISKDYSTDKSSVFINGVLDKIYKDFTKNKKIVKIGRGLV